MTRDIGKGCDGSNETNFATATINAYLVPWIYNIVDDGESYVCVLFHTVSHMCVYYFIR